MGILIKQIWFVRNVKRLINYLSITISAFILLYSILSIWAIGGGADIGTLMTKYSSLIIVPVVGLAISVVFLWKYHSAPSSKAITDNDRSNGAVTEMKQAIIKTLLCGTNLLIALLFFFIQINALNTAKELDSFGILPIYLCLIGGVIFYVTVLTKALKG